MKQILIAILTSTLLFAASSKQDEKTGLIWQDNHEIMEQELVFTKAQSYCKKLQVDGFTNWRVPTLKELVTIVNLKTYKPALKNGFDMRISDRFWSTTQDADNPRNGWVVSFRYGEIESYPKSRQYHIRCVRNMTNQKNNR